jgi:ribosome biogenesis GTPase / thiamine phosphate phosphatase
MTLQELGWNSVHERAWNEFDRHPHFPARVIEAAKNSWRVASETGESLMEISGRLRHRLLTPDGWPAVGDWVEAGGGIIHNVLPRRSKLSRKAAGRRTDEQIVAANVDTVFVVSSFDKDFNPRRVERYLTVVWEGGAKPVIVLNKADLCDETARLVRDMEAVAVAVPVYAISATNAEGLDQLQPHLRAASTVALVGSSGVGKSTLINRLCGFDRQDVRTLGTDGRGRHTTSVRSLIVLPSGALLIDTPGMRELQLWGREGSLKDIFQEIEHLALECRFRDCRHTDEPGCAVLQAVKRGETPQDRYDSYLKLRKELAFLQRKQDLSEELAQKRKWRAIHKAHRAMQKMHRKIRDQ